MREEPATGERDDGISIAIVGAGPRGVSLVERLSANASLAGARDVYVVLFDPFGAGGGRIWAGDQPQHLLMNTLCADATHFTDSTVECEGPIVAGPTLYEWCQLIKSGEVSTSEDGIRDESARVEPWSHVSRKLMGRYLEWCYVHDVERLPENVRVVFQRGLVTAIERDQDGYLVRKGDAAAHFDCVVLASGHSDMRASGHQSQNAEFARARGLFYGAPTSPLDQDLSAVLPGQSIILRGLGMNFFDYVSLLTVGRGGEFTEDGSGRLSYAPSGQEPVMVVGSRRGVPYRAKGMFGAMTPAFPRRYNSDEYLKELETGARQIDFMTDLWPRIVKDAARTYYNTLFETEPDEFGGTPEQIQDALDKYEWGAPELERVLVEVVPAVAKRIDFEKLDRPLAGATFENYDDFLQRWRADLVEDYQEAVKGYASALKCASVALGAGRAPIRTLARYGRMLGQSYARDVEGWFRGYGGAMASGPPAERIRELIALVDAGLVRPIGPDMRVDRTPHSFVASSPAVPGIEHGCQGLLDAHLPPANFALSANPVVRSLSENGMARPFVIPDAVRGDFVSGALEVGPEPYLVLDAEGEPQLGFYAIGVPLEAIHWGTQLGPLARTNSQFLRDNDAIARAALVHGKEAHVNRAEDEIDSARVG